jgi:hypothetical protein
VHRPRRDATHTRARARCRPVRSPAHSEQPRDEHQTTA